MNALNFSPRGMARLGLTLFFATFLAACASAPAKNGACLAPCPNATPRAEAAKPLRLSLVISDVYCKDSACSCVHHVATRQYADFFRLLKERYGIDVTPKYYEEAYQVEESIRRGDQDGVIGKPWPVLRDAKAQRRVFVRVADVEDIYRNTRLWGTFVVAKGSPIRSLQDATGKRFSIGQEDAFEKHQAALQILQKNGVPAPANDKLIEKASCIESLGDVMDKKADVAVISHYALTAGCAVDFASPKDFRVIAETDKIPFTSLMLDAKKISAANARRIQAAVIELSQEALPESMSGGGFAAPTPWDRAELQ